MDTNKVTEAVLKGSTPEIMDKVVKFMSTYIFYCWEIEERIFRLSRWFSYNKTIRIMAAIFEMALYYPNYSNKSRPRILTRDRIFPISFHRQVQTIN